MEFRDNYHLGITGENRGTGTSSLHVPGARALNSGSLASFVSREEEEEEKGGRREKKEKKRFH